MSQPLTKTWETKKMNQVKTIESFLAWLKSCPFKCTISSMQGSFMHVKFFLGKAIDEEEE